jgi:hypothetical protein
VRLSADQELAVDGSRQNNSPVTEVKTARRGDFAWRAAMMIP